MKKILVLVLLPMSLMANPSPELVESHHCLEGMCIEKSMLEINSIYAGVFGETWICPKKACGYENYTAIKSCALCGTKQP